MENTPLTSRRALVLAATLVSALTLAACGASGSSNSASAGAGGSGASVPAGASGARAAQFITCLKQHGVTPPQGFGRFRRGATGASGPAFRPGAGRPGGPGANGGGFFLLGGGRPRGATGASGFAGRFANNPKLAAAFRACAGAAFPGRGNFNPANAKQFRAQRDAAIRKFIACVKQQGYTGSLTPNLSGNGPVLAQSLQTDKQFLAAAKPCESLLQPGGRGGAGAPPGAPPAPAA